MRPAKCAKGVGLSPSVYISVTTYHHHPECNQCSAVYPVQYSTGIALSCATLRMALHCSLLHGKVV